MSAISNFLTFLRSAIYAIDVRDGIADAIEQCYNDVNNPTLKTEALEAALQNKIDEGEMAALTIGDHTITAAKLAQGVIDNTLTTSGAAADAKKTGDEIAAVKADLGDKATRPSYISDNLYSFDSASSGYYNASGEVVSSSDWYRTALIDVSTYGKVKMASVTNVGSTPCNVFFGADGTTVINTFRGSVGESYEVVPANAKYLSCSVHRDDKSRYKIYGITYIELATENDIEEARSELDNYVRLQYNKSGNLYVISETISGEYWNEQGGIGTSAQWYRTPPIDISAYQRIKYSGITNVGTNPKNIFFGADGQTVIEAFQPETGEVTKNIPDGAKYVAFSIHTSNRSAFSLYAEAPEESYIGLTGIRKNTSTMNLAYSWWVTNRCIDAYGNLYFGYISGDAMAGVGIIYPDGSVYVKDLWKSADNDDHNAPSVQMITQNGLEYALVVGTKGHSKDSKMYVFKATLPNTIDCDFTDLSVTIQFPSAAYKLSYAQTFVIGTAIYNFFRVYVTSPANFIWMCAKSADYGATWSFYRLFHGDGQMYLGLSRCTDEPNIIRIIVARNPRSPISMFGGYVDVSTNAVMDASGNDVSKPMTLYEQGTALYGDGITIASHSDLTIILNGPDYGVRRRRLLASFPVAFGHMSFLTGIAVDLNALNFEYYLHRDGVMTKVGESGRPFYVYSSYIGGADFLGTDGEIIYAKNDTDVANGAYSLHKVVVNDSGVLVSDTVVKRSNKGLIKPFSVDGTEIMYLVGSYNDISTTTETPANDMGFKRWQLGIQTANV